MTGFALLGGWTVGRNVIATMGGEIILSQFTLAASVAILTPGVEPSDRTE